MAQHSQSAFKQPITLFSIVVLGCIANKGYINRSNEVEEYCIFNCNQNAYNYGVTMGVLCFFSSAAFLVLDAYFLQISGMKDRKKAIIADIGVSGETLPLLDLSWFCVNG
uniref:MARVEL domain-containing protein n=1 Tax=Monopterus albus TaxID=43700 RepID=A0A3Q3K4U3_MONAL